MAKRKASAKKDISNIITATKVIKINPLVLAVIFLVSALIIFLSIASYSRLDLSSWSAFSDLFEGIEKRNWLGIVGANIGKAFFEYTLGYPALIFPAYFAFVGFQLVRKAKKNLFYHPMFTFLFQLSFILSISFAMPEALETAGRMKDYFPSGLIGGLSAELLVRMFGNAGSVITLISYLLAVLFVFFPQWFKSLKIPKISLPKRKLPKVVLDRSEDEPIVDEGDETIVVEEKSAVVYDESSDRFVENVSQLEASNKEIQPLDEKKFLKTAESKEHIDLAEAKLPVETVKASDEIKEETVEEEKVEKAEPIIEKSVESLGSEEAIADEVPEAVKSAVNLNEINQIANDYFDDVFYDKSSDSTPSDEKPEVQSVEKKDDPSEENLEEPEFTIEDEVVEKQGNLDKTHKKLTKRERYNFPSIDLLADVPIDDSTISEEELWQSAKLLEEKLQDFKVDAKVVNVVAGPVITMFELRPALGVRVSKIESLMPDIALKMAARGIRYLGQLPGKDTIGIELPNANPKIVYFKEIINSKKFVETKDELPVCLGKAVNGEIIIRNLASMPHLLVAGATGAGKSVGLNAIITSLLYSKHPDDLKFVMIDPKMLELGLYNKLENHHLAFSSDLNEKVVTNPENAVAILRSVVQEMEKRYKYLAGVSVRNIKEYNDRVAGKAIDPKNEESEHHEKLPYIVVVIDELADLMITAGKEIEEPIARLTQMARAVGIHCIIATQRPSVDVITGVIKANIPTRIAFQTATKIDSRTILDLMGAEQLLGRGDMLYLPPGQAKPIRIQNAFLDTEEIEEVLAHIKVQEFSKRLDLPLVQDEEDGKYSSRKSSGSPAGKKDDLFDEAKVAIVMNQAASISFLQRRLGIGYSRAAKIVDQLEDEGIVGPPNKSNRREVLMSLEDLEGYENIPLDN